MTSTNPSENFQVTTLEQGIKMSLHHGTSPLGYPRLSWWDPRSPPRLAISGLDHGSWSFIDPDLFRDIFLDHLGMLKYVESADGIRFGACFSVAQPPATI